ncbi:MAG TPA: type VI secretion system protein TssL, short form [Pseudomonas sp.]|uniref:type VI secretion system protein TssL, short form n=1 Tax=Pseudomonas sp. TaxID=306 RepID=UPI002ED97CD2
MSPIKSQKMTATAVDIDSLLQDSYLLVVELRQGSFAQSGQDLYELCVRQIEQVREQLISAGLSQRSIDHISHAQCALLDETVLGYGKDEVHARWFSEPLQAQFFNRHQAGESLYEDMRDVLREPAPDEYVLTAFHRVLMLGFQGRYRDADDPEREQLLAALNMQVTPLKLSHTLKTQVNAGRTSFLQRMQSPAAHTLAAGLLLVGVWWGLDRYLGGLIAMFMPGQA